MRGLNWTTMLLIGGLILVVLIVAYFATRGSSDQDKLTNTAVATSTPANHEKICASSATYGLIKRELFRRAAQLRGNNQAAYDELSTVAVLRMENPVMESEDTLTGAVNCSGSLSLDLPPGVAAVGGRTTLMSDVDYKVQPAADGSGNVVLLKNAEAIIAPLATLARTSQPLQVTPNDAAPESSEENQVAPEVEHSASQAPSTPTQPSFSCQAAHTSGEAAVCHDPGLAALDRNMASEYGHAFAVATPDQRDLLKQTARRFYAYRDRCPDSQCIAAAYSGRIREIRDIIQGRWQPPQ